MNGNLDWFKKGILEKIERGEFCDGEMVIMPRGMFTEIRSGRVLTEEKSDSKE